MPLCKDCEKKKFHVLEEVLQTKPCILPAEIGSNGHCNKPIRYERGKMCSSCSERMKRCEKCGKSIGEPKALTLAEAQALARAKGNGN